MDGQGWRIYPFGLNMRPLRMCWILNALPLDLYDMYVNKKNPV